MEAQRTRSDERRFASLHQARGIPIIIDQHSKSGIEMSSSSVSVLYENPRARR